MSIPATGPDFSHVTSAAQAEELTRAGRLEQLLLLPEVFGGRPDPGGEGHPVLRPPEYEGASFIPIAIKITASDPGEFTTTIAVWGSALNRSEQ